jgi:transcription factor TFIIIB component B''
MSSVVNKSSTRFTPKITTRGGSSRPQQRRLSTVSVNEPVRLRGVSQTPKPVPLKPVPAPQQVVFKPVKLAAKPSEDGELRPPSLPPPKPPQASLIRESDVGIGPLVSARTSNIRGDDEAPPPLNISDAIVPDTISARVSNLRGGRGETPPRSSGFNAINSVESRKRRAGETIDTLDSYDRGKLQKKPPRLPETVIDSYDRGKLRKKPPRLPETAASTPPAPSPPRAEIEPSPPREIRRDNEGRIIIDPEFLPKVCRGRKQEEVEESEAMAINIHTFTMAHLCKDIPVGRKNPDFDKYEQARRDRKEHREKLLKAKREARRNNVPFSEVPILRDEEEKRLQYIKDNREERLQEFRRGSGGPAVVKLKMDSSGNILVDEESTVVDRHEASAVPDDERQISSVDNYAVVTNSASFSTKEKPERWDAIETDRFYQALSMWGTDFNLIAQMFPGRSRHQIKTKFKLEERRNPAKVHLAILRKLPVDLDDYSRLSGTALTPVAAIEQELLDIRTKHEEILKAEEQARDRARVEDIAAAERTEAERFGQPVKKDEQQEQPEIQIAENEIKEETIGDD